MRRPPSRPSGRVDGVAGAVMVNRRKGADAPIYDPDLGGIGGDVAVARTIAHRMLSASCADADPWHARLLLTAACLYLGSRNGPEATLSDVQDLLEEIGRSLHATRAFEASPMQFLRYVGLELRSLDESTRTSAVRQSIAAARLCTAGSHRETAGRSNTV